MNRSKRMVLLMLFNVFFLSVCISANASTRSVGKVTGYEKITWGISTGRYYVNNIHAFCAQYNKSWPLVNTEIVEISVCENEVLRKALYYGYNGPANTLGTDDRAHVLTAIAVSDANIGERETGAAAKYDAFYWELVENPSKYPSPPQNFKAYMAITKGDDLQNLAFYEVEKNGYVKINKSSSNPTITEKNNCYALEGAEYTVYNDLGKVGVLTTDSNGESGTLELGAGIYCICETKAPKGYQKSEEIKEFEIRAEEVTTLHFKDDPKVCRVELLVQKVDKETGDNKPQGLATLKGAVFEVKFYGETMEPLKQWVFETDENGRIFYDDAYLVSGDALYEEIPLGTLTVQEIKASPGYLLNEKVFTQNLSEGIVESIVVEEVYDKPKPYDFIIHKMDRYGNLLCGAEFTLYADEQCEEVVQKGSADENGLLRLAELEVGRTYYLQETKAPDGYEYSDKIYKFLAVYNPVTEEFICDTDGEITLTETNAKKEVHMSITNEIKYHLPETGSYERPILTLTGILVCALGIYLTTKEKRRRKL